MEWQVRDDSGRYVLVASRGSGKHAHASSYTVGAQHESAAGGRDNDTRHRGAATATRGTGVVVGACHRGVVTQTILPQGCRGRGVTPVSMLWPHEAQGWWRAV